VIESTLLIARRLGISVVAEGVETQEQFERLSAMGVELFQGYYFGRPAPIAINGCDMKLSIGVGSG
jgi:EAL domain-containing protein (putative c-di-GMP-specific phosphodiesterase class I)